MENFKNHFILTFFCKFEFKWNFAYEEKVVWVFKKEIDFCLMWKYTYIYGIFLNVWFFFFHLIIF